MAWLFLVGPELGVPFRPVTVSAIIGSTLIALLLTGSVRIAATSPNPNPPLPAQLQQLKKRALEFFNAGRYSDAHDVFVDLAQREEKLGFAGEAARNWNSGGGCLLYMTRFREALENFSRARQIAEAAHETKVLAWTLNNLASLYLQTGRPELAMQAAREGLAIPIGKADIEGNSKLLYQMANALAELGRMDEAAEYYRQSLAEMTDRGDLAGTARVWGMFGTDLIRAGRMREAESALNEALRLIRTHHLTASGTTLLGLANLRSRQGDHESAGLLYASALAAPAGTTPEWKIYADRGWFRLHEGDLRGAFGDFRKSRETILRLRADMVPADEDRVAFEKRLSQVSQAYEGFVDSGNRLARETGDNSLLLETFDAAEQDRLWSLRALVPSSGDWRSRLPNRYWELLTRYQALDRAAVAGGDAAQKAEALRQELGEMETRAAGDNSGDRGEAPLRHVRKLLPEDTVLLSFHVSSQSSWVWAIDRESVAVFPLPSASLLKPEVTAFAAALREGNSTVDSGLKLYSDLFGGIPAKFLRRRHWRLELDGPLYELPFAALVTGNGQPGPEYLVEKADVSSIPGALLAERGSIRADGAFLGIGDPVYNAADERYRGSVKPATSLPRLPNTESELESCARTWNARSELLTGEAAGIESVRSALRSSPGIIHFATHVVTGQGDFQSGLIALSLDHAGVMGLLGPREIVARATGTQLVVMDGCHSAQGETLPAAGLMGLTRAWLGAGAMSVLATQWDVPDSAAQSVMTGFYTALKKSPAAGPAAALREAQLAALREPSGRLRPSSWAGYFLLSRIL